MLTMKKIITMAFLILTFNSAYSQQNYYNGQEIFIDNTLAFQCRSSSGGFILSNKFDVETTMRNQEIPDNINDWEASAIVRTNAKFKSNAEILRAFNETFTQTELNSFTNEHMGLHFTFNNSGDIVRLSIDFNNNNAMTSISPQKYATLYKKIKQYVKFNVTVPKLYYNFISFNLDLNKVKNQQVLFHSSHY